VVSGPADWPLERSFGECQEITSPGCVFAGWGQFRGATTGAGVPNRRNFFSGWGTFGTRNFDWSRPGSSAGCGTRRGRGGPGRPRTKHYEDGSDVLVHGPMAGSANGAVGAARRRRGRLTRLSAPGVRMTRGPWGARLLRIRPHDRAQVSHMYHGRRVASHLFDGRIVSAGGGPTAVSFIR
jgi:hypothetical protein